MFSNCKNIITSAEISMESVPIRVSCVESREKWGNVQLTSETTPINIQKKYNFWPTNKFWQTNEFDRLFNLVEKKEP